MTTSAKARGGHAKATRAVRAEARRVAHERDLAEYVKRVVDESPPLSPEQCDLLVSLLRPTRGAP